VNGKPPVMSEPAQAILIVVRRDWRYTFMRLFSLPMVKIILTLSLEFTGAQFTVK
jgi:hypothetical protein